MVSKKTTGETKHEKLKKKSVRFMPEDDVIMDDTDRVDTWVACGIQNASTDRHAEAFNTRSPSKP